MMPRARLLLLLLLPLATSCAEESSPQPWPTERLHEWGSFPVGSWVEYRISRVGPNHSPDFVEVDTVDAYESVNHAIMLKREEEAELNRPPGLPRTGRRMRHPATPAIPTTIGVTYHRQVEAVAGSCSTTGTSLKP